MEQPFQGKHIDPRALPYWRIRGTISSAVIWLLTAAAFVLWQTLDFPLWLAVGATIFALACSITNIALIPTIRWNTWRYIIADQQIELRYGVLIRHHLIIPMVRVQHVDTEQGPLLKRFGLSTVTIATAAGRHEIPALADAVAEEVREKISILARVVDEDV